MGAAPAVNKLPPCVTQNMDNHIFFCYNQLTVAYWTILMRVFDHKDPRLHRFLQMDNFLYMLLLHTAICFPVRNSNS